MLKIYKPEGSEKLPHLWTIEADDGMYIAIPLQLVPELAEKQAEIIFHMVDAYNSLFAGI